MTISITTREPLVLPTINAAGHSQPACRTALGGPSLQGASTTLPALCSGTSLEEAIVGLMEWGGGVWGVERSPSRRSQRKVSQDSFPSGSREAGAQGICFWCFFLVSTHRVSRSSSSPRPARLSKHFCLLSP